MIGDGAPFEQLANELHKPIRRHFNKRRVFTRGIDQIWAADLIEMQQLANENDGYRYILAVIDTFSKFGWMRPLKSKSGVEVAAALNEIINSSKRMPEKVWTDLGLEFRNKYVQTLGFTLYFYIALIFEQAQTFQCTF